MVNETANSLSLSLDQQVEYLRRLVEQLTNTLQRGEASYQAPVIDHLILLSENISQLSQRINKRERERKNLLALADIGRIVNSSLQLDEVLRIVMDTMIRLTKAERGFLMLRDETGGLSINIARNWEQESIHPSEFAISGTVISRVINEGQPILTTNAKEDPRFGGQESIVAFNLRSILCVPLKVKDELTGVIYADNRIRSGIFTDSERDLLAGFANQAAVAIENARLFESVRRTLAEVTELKNFMDNVFASIASGVITADTEANILMSNRAAEAILGQVNAGLVGRTLSDVLPLSPADLNAHINRVWQSGQNITGVEYQPLLPGRGPVILSLNLSPLKDASETTQGVAIVLDDLTDKKRLEAQRRLFERMVSPAVIEQLDPDKLQLGGKRAKITTLFADIRGFTSFSEELNPEQLVAVLNRYLAVAAESVLAHQGTIDKFMGDAIMAWFNAPIPQTDHTLRAVRAALGIQAAVARLQTSLPPEYRLSFGAGIHYGEAVLGLVGTERRMEYTAIGDSVNTAKRIQENSAADQILISEQAYECVRDHVLVRPVGPILAKGKRLPVQVFEVFGLKM
jgi:PAS domain S-box-containing protein